MIGKRLRYLRKERKIKQEDLAKVVGVCKSNVVNLTELSKKKYKCNKEDA